MAFGREMTNQFTALVATPAVSMLTACSLKTCNRLRQSKDRQICEQFRRENNRSWKMGAQPNMQLYCSSMYITSIIKYRYNDTLAVMELYV